MCHPAVVDVELMAVSDYNAKRGEELEILTSEKVKAAIRDAGITLTTFRDI